MPSAIERGRRQHIGRQAHLVIGVGVLEVDGAIGADDKGAGHRQDVVRFAGDLFEIDTY
jgi:hypothetical protein